MKRGFLNYLSFATFSIAFIFISTLVKLNKRNSRLISKKIKFGVALITLTSIFNSCSNSEKNVVTCYQIPESDSTKIETINGTLNKDTVAIVSDSIGISNPQNRATCYGAPANLNNLKNE